jgi:hypothetical protein
MLENRSGSCALICIGETYNNGIATPSTLTSVPAIRSGSAREKSAAMVDPLVKFCP